MKKSTRLIITAAAITGLYAGSLASKAFADDSAGKPAAKEDGKDKSSCKGKDGCKGKNDCKGKGGCGSSDNGCKGKNSCKGKGGCGAAEMDKEKGEKK